MRPARLERATFWFVAKRSIQLSYGRGFFVVYHRSGRGGLSYNSGKRVELRRH